MRALKFLIQTILLLAMLPLLLAIVLYLYFFTTQSGLDRVASFASQMASSPGQEISITQLRGNVLGKFTVGEFTIADEEGIWLVIEEARISWEPFALLANEPPLQLAEAKKITLKRLPVTSEKESDEGSVLPDSSDLMYMPRRLLLEEILIEEAVAGARQRLFMKAAAVGENAYGLALHRIEGPLTTLEAGIAWEKDDWAMDATLKEAANGVVGVLTGMEATKDMTLQARASMTEEGQPVVQLVEFKGHYDGSPIVLKSPATLTLTEEGAILTPLTITMADGTLSAQGEMNDTSLQGELHVKSIALHKIPTAGLPRGVVTIDAKASGTKADPVLSWDSDGKLRLSGYRLNYKAKGTWAEDRLRADLSINSDKASATGDISFPAALSLSPFTFDVASNAPLAGKMDIKLPLAVLNDTLRQSGHEVAGNISGKAIIQGTLEEPDFEGNFTLVGGSYDHYKTGVCLRNVQAKLRGTGERITLESLQATDPQGQKLTGSGSLTLGEKQEIRLDTALHQFKLFCGGMADGIIDGTLATTGTFESLLVKGNFVLGPLNVQIPGAEAGSEIPSVETQWVRRRGKLQEEAAQVTNLDINVSALGRLYIRGRGLDAEFEGNLHIGGTASDPQLKGLFKERRGRFTLLDRVLNLEKAQVRFEGPMPPSPYLDVRAVTTVDDTQIIVSLSGPAEKPALTLSSSPSLPQDEVLALLLFGRELDKISPFEAVKLAQAARTLAGKDSGQPGLVSNIRSTLGLDALDVGTGDDNNVTVTTGKYITNNVYVGVTQGATPESREVVTEIDLTPSISAKTSIDGSGNQGVGFEWKYDY